MLLRLGDQCRLGRGCLHHARGLLLGAHQAGKKAQVVADGVALGLLRQARGTVGEQAGRLGQADAGQVGAVEGFDLAGLKNALHEIRSPEMKLPPGRGCGPAAGSGERSGQLLSPVTLRYQPRWCCLAQARVTVP
jgi:hypothetical protein